MRSHPRAPGPSTLLAQGREAQCPRPAVLAALGKARGSPLVLETLDLARLSVENEDRPGETPGLVSACI